MKLSEIFKGKEAENKQKMNKWKEEIYIKSKNADYANELVRMITELLQENIEHCGEKDCPECNQKAFKAGYNYARKEMKQWAEEKKWKGNPEMETNQVFGRNEVLQELLEELK